MEDDYYLDHDDDGLDADGNHVFECAAFPVEGGGLYCPLQGSEECDWECPLS